MALASDGNLSQIRKLYLRITICSINVRGYMREVCLCLPQLWMVEEIIHKDAPKSDILATRTPA